ncbi:MAG: DNA polymerase III subunit epsilon [Paracoccaceae bacterium]
MREIVLDTETTGLDPEKGDRLVEIGCVELLNHMPTGKTYHQYINPQRDMPIEAFNVHGLSEEFLSDKPLFAEIVPAFREFIGDARLVIHNASFDMKFLNAELRWAELDPIPMAQALDTLEIARRKYPGAQNSLDALCRRFNIDNSSRVLHGALLDSEILAEVYLELIGGRQPDFGLSVVHSSGGNSPSTAAPIQRPKPLPCRITDEERTAHAAFIAELGDDALWNKL